MNVEDFRAIRDKLEPEAGAVKLVDVVAISIAVSLKRIANRLDEIDKIGGITHSLERLATEFERSQRS